MKKLVFFITSFILTSCINEIDSSFLNAKDELVLECFISPSDTLIKAVLSKATSFSNKEIEFDELFIKDAQVFISDYKTRKKLIYNTTKKYYQVTVSTDFKIEKGEKYFIQAITKEGEILNASCVVPSKEFNTTEIEIEKTSRGNELVDVRLKWLPNTDDFYQIKPYYYISNSMVKDKPIAQSVQYFKGIDIIENKAISNYFTNDLTVGSRKNTVFFNIVDQNYFEYFKMVQLNKNNQIDPFSQPINVTSNIQGGFGCFGSYVTTRLDFEI